MDKKYALISVYNKRNLRKICKSLLNNNINIISTGATAKHISSLGIPCKLVRNFTKSNEILDGRVKTLHPKIYASILFERENRKHVNFFKKTNFPIIDFVVVNLYPFNKVIKKTKNINKCIDMIDIGGHALLRSSSKNYKNVTIISDTNDYKFLIKELEKNKGTTTLKFRKKMALKAFKKTCEYDQSIFNWLKEDKSKKHEINYEEKINLRYGENPFQKSFLYKTKKSTSYLNNIIQGKKLSYNNILDSDSAINCINEFAEPTCVIIKHNNPCAVCSNKKIERAFYNAYKSDAISAFGGIVALNRPVNLKLAKKISKFYFEILIAKNFTNDALRLLRNKKNLIIIKNNNSKNEQKSEIKSINGGYLFQEKNNIKININNFKCMSKIKASKNSLNDLVFAYRVCKHVKSNAVVLVKNKQTIGIGAGQMSRLDATKLSILKSEKKARKSGFVAASDAFFPFIDNIKLLSKNNCKSIVQAGGSINDSEIIKCANSKKISLYFSKHRMFRH